MAVANYTEANGHLPPAYLADDHGRPMHSWRVLILPYMEHEHVFRAYNFSEPWNGPANRQLADQIFPIYTMPCHRDARSLMTSYVVVVGNDTAFPPDKSVKLAEIGDGCSNTILITEIRDSNIHWMEPRDLLFDEMDFTIDSPRGISSCYAFPSAAMIDGSVRGLHKTLAPETLRALLTINGKEQLEVDPQRGWELIPDGRKRPLAE